MDDVWLQALSILSATFRMATPLVFCAMAGVFSERSGTIDIGLEGKMLATAFAAACFAAVTGSAWVALFGAVIVGVSMALLHGVACITYRGNQVVSGVAINIMAAGLTLVLGNAWFGRGGQTPDLTPDARFMPLKFPGMGERRLHSRHRPDLFLRDRRPQPAGLCRLPGGAAGLVGALSHALRPAGCARSARIRRWSTPPASR